MKLKALLLFLSIATLFVACNDEPTQVKETKNKVAKKTPDDGRGASYEAYMAQIDGSDSLTIANTLYYTKENGESYQAFVLIDDSSHLVRIEEKYTLSSSGSLLTNVFYYKNDVKIASKEIFIEGSGATESFVERVSYYKNGKAEISKERRAQFEEYLKFESFNLIPPHDCSDKRANRALRREGEFVTNFVSVVYEDPATYVIVGEGTDNGYVSALVVQRITPLVNQMKNDPESLKNKRLDVDFQEMNESTGFTFQALLNVRLVK